MISKYYTTTQAYKQSDGKNNYLCKFIKYDKKLFAPSLIGILCMTSCISQENPPKVETPDQSKYTTESIVDGIDIPWGMDFISENEIW